MTREKIVMVDLVSQYQKVEDEINSAIFACIRKATFINGPEVKDFEGNLAKYLNVEHVIGCANGTDALQIALMALNLQPGDEVIVPAFTYVATAEVIALLKLKPVMVDVDSNDFNINTADIEKYITARSKAIVPVHLYGQPSNMEEICRIAAKYNLFIVEDNAQAIGSEYIFNDGTRRKTGTIGHIGCTSFFPSKNLGCYGDGGALVTNDASLADKIRVIANHGQKTKYHHSVVGVNSRLDSIQAAILNVKLNYLDGYTAARNKSANIYDELLKDINDLQVPFRSNNGTHAFHQYTIKVKSCKRDSLRDELEKQGIPSMVYYPIPLYRQEAFKEYFTGSPLPHTETLCEEVLSLPMHTELQEETIQIICDVIKKNL